MDDVHPVYDLFCPSPVLLKDLASFELALNIWQGKVFELRENKTLHKWKNISNTRPASRMPNLPRSLALGIDKYIGGIIKSIEGWLKSHIDTWNTAGPHTNRSLDDCSILNHFVDFVGDWDGSIHYERTARRMMLCDGIDVDLKFKTACMYFLEEDVMKLWPSGPSHMLRFRYNCDQNREVNYWVERLRNQLSNVPPYDKTTTIETRLPYYRYTNVGTLWSAIKYFNISSRNLLQNEFGKRDGPTILVRYFLLEYLLDEVLLGSALPLVKKWFKDGQYSNSKQVLAVWECIKDKMTSEDLTDIIWDILHAGFGRNYLKLDPFPLVELWNEMSNDFKQLAAEKILQNLNIKSVNESFFHRNRVKELSSLLAILSWASTESRKAFWNSKWRDLIVGIKYDEFLAMMELCIGDPAKINEFKQNELPAYENIFPHCLHLLTTARFSELEEFLKLYFLDDRSMKNFKQRLLKNHNFQNMEPVILFNNARLFKQFIYSSCEVLEDASNLIAHVLFSSDIIEYLKKLIVKEGWFSTIMRVIDTFAPSEHMAEILKREELLPALLSQFKSSQKLSVYKNIRVYCLNLLMKARFSELDEFLRLCFSDERSVKQLQKKLLKEHYFKVDVSLLDKADLFKQFIYSSFEALEDANHFINELLCSRNSRTSDYLEECMVKCGLFHPLMHFIDTLAPTDDFAQPLKHEKLVPAFLSKLTQFRKNDSRQFCLQYHGEDVGQLMVWCLKDENEIASIKQQINLDELMQKLLLEETHLMDRYRTKGKLPSHCVIVQVMNWVLGTDQAVEEFKRKYTHDELFKEWFCV